MASFASYSEYSHDVDRGRKPASSGKLDQTELAEPTLVTTRGAEDTQHLQPQTTE